MKERIYKSKQPAFCPHCHKKVSIPDFINNGNISGRIKVSCINCSKGRVVFDLKTRIVEKKKEVKKKKVVKKKYRQIHYDKMEFPQPNTKVLGFNSIKKKSVINKVKDIEIEKQGGVFYELNEKVLIYANQSIFANGNITHAKHLKVGDKLIGKNGKTVILKTLKRKIGKYYFYRLKINGNHSYYLNDILMHNASRFWVGGTGTWNGTSTTNWAATSGGGSGASVPTASDDVTFDSASNGSAYTCTVASAVGACLNLTIGNPSSGAITFAGTIGVGISGNLSIASGITCTNTGIFTFNATSGTKTIATNSNSLTTSFAFNGSGGTFQLIDSLTTSGTAFQLFAGSFSANSQLVTFNIGSTATTIQGTFTFSSLTLSGAAGKFGEVIFTGNIIVSSTFTATGNSLVNRFLVRSNTLGTGRTITAATVSITNVDFQDINGAGAGSWSGTSVGNAARNTGITFTSPVTRYAVAAGNYDSTSMWSSTSGGGSGSSVPLCHDSCIFDASSGAGTYEMNQYRIGSIDCTNFTRTLSFNSFSLLLFGSLKLVAGMTLGGNQGIAFHGDGSYNLTSGGKTFPHLISFNTTDGGYIMQDDFNCSNTVSIAMNGGSLDLNDFDFTAAGINGNAGSSSSARSINLRSGLITLSGVTSLWSAGTMTVTAGTSQIKFTNTSGSNITFAGGGQTYYNVWWDRGASAGNITISGNNTFTEFKNTGTAAHNFILTASSTQTITSAAGWVVEGASGAAISLQSTTTTNANVSISSGVINTNWLTISNVNATGGATFYAGPNSSDASGDSAGWIFTAAPFTITKSLKYTVKITPSTITKSLKYTVRITPSTITKSLKYTVKSSVAAITKSLKYTVKAAHAAITKSLKYTVRITPATITKNLIYRVRKALTITKTLIYKVRPSVTIQKSLKYTVKRSITAITKSLKYTIRKTAATITKSLKYAVRRTPATITKTLIYKVRPSVTIAKSLKYTVKSAHAAITKSLKYTVRISITAITKSLKYTVKRTPATITKSLKYTTKITPATITKSLKYTVFKVLTITKTLIYKIRKPLTITKSLKYTTKISVAAIQKSLTYRLAVSQTPITKTLVYKIKAPAVVTKSLKYVVTATPATITKSLYYEVVKRYSREQLADINVDDSDLATLFTPAEIIKTEADDDEYVGILTNTLDEYGVELFKFNHFINNTDQVTIMWKGKTTLSPSASAVFLQIFNFDTGLWETIDSDNTIGPNIEFVLQGSVTSGVQKYYEGSMQKVVARVYQKNL